MLRLLDIENAKAISKIQLNRFVEYSSEIPSHDTKCKLFRAERIQPDDIITIWSCPVWSCGVTGRTDIISASVRGNNRPSVFLIFRFSEIVLCSLSLRRLRSFEMAGKGKLCCPFNKVNICGSQFLFVPRFEGWYLRLPLHRSGQILEQMNFFTWVTRFTETEPCSSFRLSLCGLFWTCPRRKKKNAAWSG